MVRRVWVCGLFLLLASIGLTQSQESDKKSTPARPRRDDALREELLRTVQDDQDARSRVIQAGPADGQAWRTLADAGRDQSRPGSALLPALGRR
jgi:hypothetical protein